MEHRKWNLSELWMFTTVADQEVTANPWTSKVLITARMALEFQWDLISPLPETYAAYYKEQAPQR